MSISTPDKQPVALSPVLPAAWPQLPNETEIYILPDGQVIIADLPAELMGLAAELGRVQPGQRLPIPIQLPTPPLPNTP